MNQRFNPSTKPTWDISEGTPGRESAHDPAALEETFLVGEDGIEFGTFVTQDATTKKIEKMAVGNTNVAGLALVSNLAHDFENAKYGLDDKAAVAKRGYFYVKLDVNNIPAEGDAVRISFDANIEGYLTSNAVNSLAAAEGITIRRVFDTMAEVFLEGKGSIVVA